MDPLKFTRNEIESALTSLYRETPIMSSLFGFVLPVDAFREHHRAAYGLAFLGATQEFDQRECEWESSSRTTTVPASN